MLLENSEQCHQTTTTQHVRHSCSLARRSAPSCVPQSPPQQALPCHPAPAARASAARVLPSISLASQPAQSAGAGRGCSGPVTTLGTNGAAAGCCTLRSMGRCWHSGASATLLLCTWPCQASCGRCCCCRCMGPACIWASRCRTSSVTSCSHTGRRLFASDIATGSSVEAGCIGTGCICEFVCLSFG